jgi:tRNA (guanine37-N1)-methyltransferase
LNVWRNCSPNGAYDEIIYVTADGEKFDQKMANDLSLKTNMIILCGHYKGIDQRVRDILITKEISIGDYVLTGGELAAMVISDAVIRLIPGAIGDGESALTDSFQDGLLDAPSYTRPPEFRGMKVPDVLLGGNHKEVAKWREKQRKLKTQQTAQRSIVMSEGVSPEAFIVRVSIHKTNFNPMHRAMTLKLKK